MSEALQPYFKESKGIQASVAEFFPDSPSKIFFPTSRLTQERRKVEYRRATYKKSIRFAVKFFVLRFAQFKKAKDCYTTSYLQVQRSVCPKPRIPFFLVHKYWGSEVTHLGWSIGSYKTSSMRKPCAKAIPETDSLTQQKQYHKRNTLCTMKILLQSIHSKEGPHYCLSEGRESCQLASDKCHIWHGYIEDPAAKHS